VGGGTHKRGSGVTKVIALWIMDGIGGMNEAQPRN
jgi:hypothetical protein